MTIARDAFASLSDDQLIVEVQRLAAAERCATASLIRSLMELDARRLYLREGCSSLFTYCTQVLHLAEGSAYNRIEVARAARKFTGILDALGTGAMTLTAVRLLSPHLTTANHAAVLAAARHKSKPEVEMLIAAMNPRPAVAPTIRKLPTVRAASGRPPDAPDIDTASKDSLGMVRSGVAPSTVASTRITPTVAARPSAVTPLAPERYKIQFTISADERAKLTRVQDLLRHSLPSGDLAALFDRALTALLQDLERRRCAVAARPREALAATPGSRHIPAAVKRDVWARDEGRRGARVR